MNYEVSLPECELTLLIPAELWTSLVWQQIGGERKQDTGEMNMSNRWSDELTPFQRLVWLRHRLLG